MKIRLLLAATLLPVTLFAVTVTPSPVALQRTNRLRLNAREQRVALLRDELKAQDARIEARIDGLVAALESVTDSKDTRTKVTRLKETTISGLMKNLEAFRQKRATLLEELRRPSLGLTEEQKRHAVEVFDARIEKRVSQVLALEASLPTHKDYARYNAHQDGDWGTTYSKSEDYRQNQRLTGQTNEQRDQLEAGLRKSIARLDQQNRGLKAQGAPEAEIARNETLISERHRQLAAILEPSGGSSTREVGKKEAADLDGAVRKAMTDLRGEFTTLFAQYHTLISELAALNAAQNAVGSNGR